MTPYVDGRCDAWQHSYACRDMFFTMHKLSQSLTSGPLHRSHLAGTASIHITLARRERCLPGRSANVVSETRVDVSARGDRDHELLAGSGRLSPSRWLWYRPPPSPAHQWCRRRRSKRKRSMSEGHVAQARTAHHVVDEYGDTRRWWYVKSAPALMLHETIRDAVSLIRIVQVLRSAARVSRTQCSTALHSRAVVARHVRSSRLAVAIDETGAGAGRRLAGARYRPSRQHSDV